VIPITQSPVDAAMAPNSMSFVIRDTEAGKSKGEDRARNEDTGRDGDKDEDGGQDIDIPSSYSSNMNKLLCNEKRKGNRMVGG
jgi:hypothetical protein